MIMNKEGKINKVKDHGVFFVLQKRTVGRLTFSVISRPGIGKRHRIKMRDSLISFILVLFKAQVCVNMNGEIFVYSKPKGTLRRAYTMKFFFHDLEIFMSKEKCRIFQEAKCVS